MFGVMLERVDETYLTRERAHVPSRASVSKKKPGHPERSGEAWAESKAELARRLWDCGANLQYPRVLVRSCATRQLDMTLSA